LRERERRRKFWFRFSWTISVQLVQVLVSSFVFCLKNNDESFCGCEVEEEWTSDMAKQTTVRYGNFMLEWMSGLVYFLELKEYKLLYQIKTIAIVRTFLLWFVNYFAPEIHNEKRTNLLQWLNCPQVCP
jgi:hypothetical protein